MQLAPRDAESLRLAYTQHVYRQQGAMVDRAVVLTGGWQTTPTSERPEPATAPTGTSFATNLAKKAKTRIESHNARNGWTKAVYARHPLPTAR
ncbi:MAG TPA: hypothetical protein VK691_10620 [Solirubrobacteraceae bacterium]|nr:hypothetical protein [Solirubrobacteraceae bacterium]